MFIQFLRFNGRDEWTRTTDPHPPYQVRVVQQQFLLYNEKDLLIYENVKGFKSFLEKFKD